MARMVQCVYLKKEAEGLDFAPYPGELGKRIYDNVSKEAFELLVKSSEQTAEEIARVAQRRIRASREAAPSR